MNYLYYDKALRYPSEKYSYSPSINYPEYVGDDVAPEENQVYDAIRKITMGQRNGIHWGHMFVLGIRF